MTVSWLANKIEQWPTTKLLPYSRNARTHSAEQIAQIAASIVEFGFSNPILAGSDGVIVAGHGRWAAAQKLGLEAVPVVVLDHLSPTQRRALVIADNRIAENAGWDDAMLRVELDALRDDDFDLSLTGFDTDALADLFEGEEGGDTGQTGDDEVPESQEAVISRPGDVWLLDGHRVLCGDATDAASYTVLMAGQKADMTFTDPPYSVNYANSAKDKMRGTNRPILNDNLGEDFEPFLKAALTPMLAHCNGAIYIAMSSSELDTLQSAFRSAGGKWSTFIIWAKNTFTMGRSDYQRQYEPILYGWSEGGKHHWCGDRDQSDVWQIKKPHKNDLHPCLCPGSEVLTDKGWRVIESLVDGNRVLAADGVFRPVKLVSSHFIEKPVFRIAVSDVEIAVDATGTVPSGGLLLVGAADVQKDRIEASVWAFGVGKESWLIEHRVLMGDTARDEVWTLLAAMLTETWTHESGAAMSLMRFALDTGFATQEAYAFVRSVHDPRVMAVKGVARGAALIGTPTAVDVTQRGKRLRRGIKLYSVTVGIAKLEFYNNLRKTADVLEDGTTVVYPAGYVHLPKVDAEFIQQLCAEQLITRRDRNGFAHREWQKMRERNESLDIYVYCRAAAAAAGLDRFEERHWLELKKQLGLPAPPATFRQTEILATPSGGLVVSDGRRPARRVVRSRWLS